MSFARLLQQHHHRPWPLPPGPWVMSQRWCDLLFAHWPLPPSALRPLLPKSLELDTWDGQAWLGVVPFRMEAVRPRGLPAVPALSAFAELNLRTYVRLLDPDSGISKPGVWFFSLDAANPIAVRIARQLFHLPYFDARMQCRSEGEWVRYASHRTHAKTRPGDLRALYRPTGGVRLARPHTLEHWLTERYCLYSQAPDGRLFRGEIHHRPWPLQPAEAEFKLNTLSELVGLTLPAREPLLHFAKRLDVVVWPLQPVRVGAAHPGADGESAPQNRPPAPADC
ncbi:MAG: YqjF family protein [Candidatus Sericytochromatia bacterium]